MKPKNRPVLMAVGLVLLFLSFLAFQKNADRLVRQLSELNYLNFSFLQSETTKTLFVKLSPTEVDQTAVQSATGLITLFTAGMTKIFNPNRKRLLSTPIRLTDNEPQPNSKTFLPIPTPYDDRTNWPGKTHQATHPSVIQFDHEWNGYKYWMAFTPYPYGNDKKENPSLVASQDGIHWVVPANISNPIVSAALISSYVFDNYLSDCHLLYNDHTKEMELWYRYVSNRKNDEIICRVKTKDAARWSAPEKMLSDAGNLLQYVSPSVLYDENKYKMWIMRDWSIYYLESLDGKIWSEASSIYAAGKPIHSWHPHISKIGGIYYLLNNDNDTNTGAGGNIYYSTSTDGINFSPEKLILGYTGNGISYDSTGVYRASMISGEKGFYLYYGQVSSSYQWTIGLATGPTLDALNGITEAELKKSKG